MLIRMLLSLDRILYAKEGMRDRKVNRILQFYVNLF